MRSSFSPTSAAARLFVTRPAAPKPAAAPVAEPRTCEWPRRTGSNPPFVGIRQALLAIQSRHA